MLNSILILVIIILIGVAFIMMIKYKQNTILVLSLGFLILLSGVYSSFTAYDYYTTYSNVYGSPKEHDPYENFNFFEYNLKNFSWYRESISDDSGNKISTRYYYETEYRTSIEFDGEENKYVVLINNKPCVTSSTYGRLNGEQNLSFYNVDGEFDTKINLKVDFTFYMSKIELKINTNATEDNIGYLNEYFMVNGLKLRILQDPPYSSLGLLSSEIS